MAGGVGSFLINKGSGLLFTYAENKGDALLFHGFRRQACRIHDCLLYLRCGLSHRLVHNEDARSEVQTYRC